MFALTYLGFVMAVKIVMMNQMSLAPSVLLHAQLICLHVKMDQNASPRQTFAMGSAVVMTFHTTFLQSVVTVLLTICSGVK